MEFFVNQTKIPLWIRFLAALFVAASAVVLVLVFMQAFRQNITTALPTIGGVWGVVAICYLSFLFAYVAVLGKSPTKYFPLASLRWPFRAGGA